MNYLTQSIVILSLTASSLVASSSVESIGFIVGKSATNATQKNNTGTITLGHEIDESFRSYEIYGTFGKEIFGMKPYLSYTNASNDDLKHQYILAGLTKYYPYKKVNFYAGVLGGYGQMKWEYNPISSSDNKYDATAAIFGLQGGVEYSFSKNLAFNLNGKSLYHDYTTHLKPNNTASVDIEHKNTISFGMGLRYMF